MRTIQEITAEMERLKQERTEMEEAFHHAACFVPGYYEELMRKYDIIISKISVLGWVKG